MILKVGTEVKVVDYNNWVQYSKPQRALALALEGGRNSCYVFNCDSQGITEILIPDKGIVKCTGLEYTLFCEDDLLNGFIEVSESTESTNLVKAFLGEQLSRACIARFEAQEAIDKLSLQFKAMS